MLDMYTKTVLTIIALSLMMIALRGPSGLIAPAYAFEKIECRLDGPIKIGSFDDHLEVKVSQDFSEAGTSSSRPLYVQVKGN
jgi:hypothetical protein